MGSAPPKKAPGGILLLLTGDVAIRKAPGHARGPEQDSRQPKPWLEMEGCYREHLLRSTSAPVGRKAFFVRSAEDEVKATGRDLGGISQTDVGQVPASSVYAGFMTWSIPWHP